MGPFSPVGYHLSNLAVITSNNVGSNKGQLHPNALRLVEYLIGRHATAVRRLPRCVHPLILLALRKQGARAQRALIFSRPLG